MMPYCRHTSVAMITLEAALGRALLRCRELDGVMDGAENAYLSYYIHIPTEVGPIRNADAYAQPLT